MKTLLIFVLGLLAGLVVTYGLCATGNLPFECTSDGNIAIVDSTGTVVDIDTSVTDGLEIDQQIYEQYSNKYSTEYVNDNSKRINGYQGGRIDITALQQVLSQIEPGQTYINYRLGFSDDILISSGAVSAVNTPGIVLMLSAGNYSTSPSGNKNIYKNGNTSESFCPLMCD